MSHIIFVLYNYCTLTRFVLLLYYNFFAMPYYVTLCSIALCYCCTMSLPQMADHSYSLHSVDVINTVSFLFIVAVKL